MACPKTCPSCRIATLTGVDDEADEHSVATSDGIFLTRTVRQRRADVRRDADAIKSIRGMPWMPCRQTTGDTIVAEKETTTANGINLPIPANDPNAQRKRFRVHRSHFEKYRCTAAGPGCCAARHHRPRRGHTSRCSEIRLQRTLRTGTSSTTMRTEKPAGSRCNLPSMINRPLAPMA